MTSDDYEKIKPDDTITLSDVISSLKQKKNVKGAINGDRPIEFTYDLTDTETEIILDGGKINFIKKHLWNYATALLIPLTELHIKILSAFIKSFLYNTFSLYFKGNFFNKYCLYIPFNKPHLIGGV